MDNLENLTFKAGCEAGSLPFYKFIFDVEGTADTFLKLEGFGKGFAVLNGFNLGRYWKIGPQKTLFVPGSILKEGENTLVVFETEGAVCDPTVEFVDKPELGE
jgi:beta-galactosidase